MGIIDNILAGLTREQKDAVIATEGRVRVVAGAGSGKTRTLVHRYAFLTDAMGIPQKDILCMTFTNKAAQEMKVRLGGMERGGAVGDFVTTIHGFCVKFLRKEIYRIGYPENYLIFDEEDMKAVIKEVLEECGIDRKRGNVGSFMDQLGAFKGNAPYIPQYILTDASVKEEDAPVLGRIILRQKRYFALDFDDLLLFTLYILKTFPEVRDKWQHQFQYIMVDEVQDCSCKEWELFTLLSRHYGNLFVVGDGDQAIYEWRGAHPEIFVNYKPEKDFFLKNNFRSRPNIVYLADCIIKNNVNRLPRTSVTMRSADGFRTRFHHCRSEKEEAETLAREIMRQGEAGFRWKDMAVLYRASYLSRSIEQVLIREKVPYVIWGGVRFFERQEIKDALAYLRLIASDDDQAFKRVVNVPSRGVGRKTLAGLQGYAGATGCSLFEALRDNPGMVRGGKAAPFVELILRLREEAPGMGIAALLEKVMEGSGLLEEYRSDTEEERLENLQELVKSVRLWEEENADEEEAPSLSAYLQDIALYTNADYRKDDDKLKLMTVHQAKGLEFRLVWIYGLNEGILPSHRTIRERGEAGLEEERRLMYVACTRAMDQLHLSDSEGYNVQTSQGKYPSRFIREAEDEDGPLYDILGSFDPELWKGTDRLIRSLSDVMPEENPSFGKGDRVQHRVFGAGTVRDTDSVDGTVTVDFDEYGRRRVSPDVLHAPEPDEPSSEF